MGNGEQKAGPRIHKIPDSSRNSPISPFRIVPRGPRRRSAGVDINAEHPTRGQYKHETAVYGVIKTGQPKTAPGRPKNPDSSRNSDILPPRSFPRGSAPLQVYTAN